MRPFENLAERLLREGVALRHVRRYIAELRDHYDDAVGMEEQRGSTPTEARQVALTRLGAEDELARGMIARPEFRAIGARFPKLWGMAGPTLLWFGVTIAVMFAIVATTKTLDLLDLGAPHLVGLQGPADAFMFFFMRGVPVAIGMLVVGFAIRQRLPLMWTLIGIAFVALLGASADAGIHFALTPDVKGELRFGLGFAIDQIPDVALRLGVMFAAMLTPLALRKRLTRLPV